MFQFYGGPMLQLQLYFTKFNFHLGANINSCALILLPGQIYYRLGTNITTWVQTLSLDIHEYFQKVFVFVFEYVLYSCIHIRVREIGKYSYSNTL